MEIWAWRCERCIEQVLTDFVLATNGVAPKWGYLICGKNIVKQKKGKKLRYKGLIVVISGIYSLEVEPVARILQELTI